MNRRGFLSVTVIATGAALVAPMSLFAEPTPPKLWGDGIHDDTAALQWRLDRVGNGGWIYLPPGKYRLHKVLVFDMMAFPPVLEVHHAE